MLALGDGDEISRELDRGVIASFAGLVFELRGDPAACERARRALDPPPCTAAPKFAVRCVLELSPSAADPKPARAAIAWRWEHGRGTVLTRACRAEVWPTPRGFAARAEVGPVGGLPQLFAGLAALILHRHGGAILHAASVELDAGVLAFIGPSGAGKSTACRHVEGAPGFSIDRLAVMPGETQDGDFGSRRTMWFAHPLTGGTPLPDMPAATPRTLPLRGVFRIHQSPNGTRIEPASRATAVAALRESSFQVGDGADAELQLLERLERLAGGVPVARLHLTLGASLAAPLRRWLVDQAKEAG